jgi:hypothetical protein
MDLDTMLADAAPARHVSLDRPDSPAAAGLYQRITTAPPPPARVPRRSLVPAVAICTAAVAGLAVAAALVLIPGATHTPRGARAQLAAWTVARQPGGLVTVTIRELRNPAGLWRMLRADGIPANVRFLPHDFTPTSGSVIPRACRAPHLSAQANGRLQSKIMPAPWSGTQRGTVVRGHAHGQVSGVTGRAKDYQPDVALTIRPAAIPHGIGLFIAAWAAAPGTRSGAYLSMETDLVQASPQCTGR